MKIALLGAESTGKTELSRTLAERLAEATGLRCAAVPEVLREWCDQAGRTPRADEQLAIAGEQAARIDAAARDNDLVVADTTPLTIAVYSDLLFADRSLYPMALAFQRGCDLTLLTALDLPWVADALQRDGEHVRAPVDAALRRALSEANITWSVISGIGPARVEAALDAITITLRDRTLPRNGLFTRWLSRDAGERRPRWSCEHCDVPECEHLSARRGPPAEPSPGPGRRRPTGY
jgi:nicotinamide riboside kinase